MYTLKYLNDQIDKGEELQYLFFWGHQPTKDETITNSCLSQWWSSQFNVDGTIYKTAEHWMMAKKAMLFEDKNTYIQIINCHSPSEAKKLGRKVIGFEQNKWEKARFDIVIEGNYHKFSQNIELKNFLLKTQNKILVEASPLDPIWGVGLAKEDSKILDPKKWKGLNLLGFALMETRDKLIKDIK